MRWLFKFLLIVVAAIVLAVPWSIAMDFAFYFALEKEFTGRSMQKVIECIDQTEASRAIGLLIVLLVWSIAILAIDRALDWWMNRPRSRTKDAIPAAD